MLSQLNSIQVITAIVNTRVSLGTVFAVSTTTQNWLKKCSDLDHVGPPEADSQACCVATAYLSADLTVVHAKMSNFNEWMIDCPKVNDWSSELQLECSSAQLAT